MAREREPQTGRVDVQAGRAECLVDLDADAAGTTDASGNLMISNVDPGDHYIHVRCPGIPEAAYFISPKVNEVARSGPSTMHRPHPRRAIRWPLPRTKSNCGDWYSRLSNCAQQARLDEAVAALRQAMKLDPENSDLHRELGITFLMAKEWKRARVEMIEAIRHDQTDADAHNGLGYALEKLGDIDGAVKEYRTATHLEPDDPTYRTHYFEALVKIQARQEVKK